MKKHWQIKQLGCSDGPDWGKRWLAKVGCSGKSHRSAALSTWLCMSVVPTSRWRPVKSVKHPWLVCPGPKAACAYPADWTSVTLSQESTEMDRTFILQRNVHQISRITVERSMSEKSPGWCQLLGFRLPGLTTWYLHFDVKVFSFKAFAAAAGAMLLDLTGSAQHQVFWNTRSDMMRSLNK